MATSIVPGIEEELVGRLETRAAGHGRSAQEDERISDIRRKAEL